MRGKCLICILSGYNLKILLSYLKSSNLSNVKISWKNKKCLNLGPKMPYLSIFGQELLFLIIFNNFYYCHIWNHHPQICQFANFSEKRIMSKFGTRNALFGHFWNSILKKYCHIWNQHPRFCRIAKFRKKSKNS